MKSKFGLFLSIGLAAAFPVTLPAQPAPSGYHTIACIKVKPGKGAEYRKFFADDVHKLEQASADSGRISAWFLLGAVMPAGSSAACDYVSILIFPGAPPAPMGLDGLGALLKKSGLAISAEDYVAQRGSMTELVSSALWRNQIAVGTLQKGDYVVVNHMKVPKMGEWIAYEKKVWQPFVSNDGSINDQMEVRLPAAPNQRGGRGGIDLHECVQEWAGPASKYVDVVVSRWQQGDGRTFDRISD
jgi:hypothetical protein